MLLAVGKDLEISKFFDIDVFPGGGVSFDDTPLEMTAVSELDQLTPTWRENSAGKPKKWYRRGKYLYFDRPVSSSYDELDIRVYAVLVSDDFNDDDIMPYNQLPYLEPFHSGIVEYLKWQGKRKIGKPEDAAQAEKEFMNYTTWMKRQLAGGKSSKILYRKSEAYS